MSTTKVEIIGATSAAANSLALFAAGIDLDSSDAVTIQASRALKDGEFITLTDHDDGEPIADRVGVRIGPGESVVRPSGPLHFDVNKSVTADPVSVSIRRDD